MYNIIKKEITDIPDLDPDEPEAVNLPELSLIEEGVVSFSFIVR